MPAQPMEAISDSDASPEPLRIALIRARYNSSGGAERFVARAMQALGDQGVEVTVVARNWSGAPNQTGARLIRCDPFYMGSVWREWSFARAVRSRLARERFDLVQSHERIPGMPVYRAGDGVHAAWLERRARSMTGLGRLGLKLNPYHRYMRWAERAMFEDPALRAVICNSRLVRDEILSGFDIDAGKLHVIPNGIDLDVFHPSVRVSYRATMRRGMGIPDSVPVLLMLGSGFARKGVGAAIAALARSGLNARLVVVGADKHAGRYREQARILGLEHMVHFIGSRADVLPFYGMADAFVLPTVYDPFPNAVLEAWACGLPVMTTTACGACDHVVEGVNGWLTEPEDVEGLARAMRELGWRLQFPAARQALAQGARAAAEPFSLPALAQALINLYRQLLDPKSSDALSAAGS